MVSNSLFRIILPRVLRLLLQ